MTDKENNKEKILFIDFDGVLAKKYTIPEEPYNHIRELLIKLKSLNYKLCCVSYNPCAVNALKNWDCDELFTAIRAGSNFIWSDNYTDETHRNNLSKSKQIEDIFNNELNVLDINSCECHFYDDTEENLDNVRNNLPNIILHLIDDKYGLLERDILNN